MTSLHVGAVLERPPGPKYAAALSFAELAFPGAVPKLGTLAKWRSQLPEGFVVSLVAPYGARVTEKGAFRMTPDLEEAVGWLRDARSATGARFVVAPTGSEMSTSQRDRDRFAAWCEAVGGQIVWAPGGIWEIEDAAELAEELGIHCAFDPLQDDPVDGDLVYCRLRAIGQRQRFSEGLLYEILATIVTLEPEMAYVSLESKQSFREATQLRRLAAGE